jgi:hypothetical protein
MRQRLSKVTSVYSKTSTAKFRIRARKETNHLLADLKAHSNQNYFQGGREV